MQSEDSRIQYLFHRYFNKTASAAERSELSELMQDENRKEEILQLLTTTWEQYEGDGDIISGETAGGMLHNILAQAEMPQAKAPVRKLVWRRVAVAAAVPVILAGGGWLFLKKNKTPEAQVQVQPTTNDAAPGAYKARLTLADGSHITLDSAALGELAKQGNTAVINKGGELLYKTGGGDGSVLYNTITTSRGETFSFVLADGSKVWLNSASSIRFPVAFVGKERRIEMTGEVYIKVAKDAQHPFIASAKGMDVLALGTEFNINAYNDEPAMQVTLLEGSVRLTRNAERATLKPGQQAISNHSSSTIDHSPFTIHDNVNIEEIVSWKDGYFHFESADLPTIMRQFARWYDVEVVYDGPVKNKKFFAIVKRNSSLKSVLAMLQDNNINYKIEGKKLIVSQ